jgi:hypothetical protein
VKAVTWRRERGVRVEEVPDPFVPAPTDAVMDGYVKVQLKPEAS